MSSGAPEGLRSNRAFADLGDRPKVLWVASTGGHLAQAHRIEGLIGRNPESVWLTFGGPQSQSLLHGRRVELVDYVAPRDAIGAVRAARVASAIADREEFDAVVSTGAAIAAFALPALALRGRNVVYVESISRSTGPSVTGRLMRLAPRVRTYTQHRSWSGRAWAYDGSILDDYRRQDRALDSDGLRVFVTLGTIRPYRFDRAIDAVCSILTPSDDVTWQLGATSRTGLPGATTVELPAHELETAIEESDVVITHAGVGSILSALDRGHIPVVLVRSASRGEHVDDHQRGIVEALAPQGLVVELDLDRPSRDVLQYAAQSIAVRSHE